MNANKITTLAGCHFSSAGLVLDEPVKRRMYRSSMSPSTVNSMKGCQASFVAGRILETEIDILAPNFVGNKFHKIAQLIVESEVRDQETIDAIVAGVCDPVFEEYGSVNKRKFMNAINKHLKGWQDLEDITAIEVNACEVACKGDIGGVPFYGIIDRLEHDGGIVDYKTGKYKDPDSKFGDDHGDQLAAYAIVQAANTGEPLVSPRLLYTGAGIARDVEVDEARIASVTEDFVSTWDTYRRAYDSGVFEYKTGALCGWCPLVNVCPAAAENGYKARVKDVLDVSDPRLPQAPRPVEPSVPEPVSTCDNTPVSPTAHLEGMNTQTYPWGEGKSWEPLSLGAPNANSFGAKSTFGVVSLAIEQIHAQGLKVDPALVGALATAFMAAVADVQETLTGSRNPTDGMATRLIGSLHTFIEGKPLTVADIQNPSAWIVSLKKFMNFHAHMSYTILTGAQS